jgi:hypothetical protein
MASTSTTRSFENRGVMQAAVALIILFSLTAAGCAATVEKLPRTSDDELSRCERLYATLDSVVTGAGVQDGGAARVKGFPYLRVNRFLASYRSQPMSSDETAWWIQRMRGLDEGAREIELANLPDVYKTLLPSGLRESGSVTGRLGQCASLLVARDLADAVIMERLRVAAAVPDDYQVWKRVLGLYPLSALAFSQGVARYQANTRARFAAPLDDLPVAGRLVRYEPSESQRLLTGAPAAILRRSRNNPLGVPMPEGRELDRLFALNAPLFEVDELDGNDRIGTPVLTEQGEADIDTSVPTLFVRIGHTRYRGEPLLQLVYSAWFPARPKTGKLDLLGGHLDGITWRVTLDGDGEPLFFDTMHTCGCYHMFFPTPRVRLRPREPAFEEPILIPARLGSRASGERVVLRIASGTHSVQNVRYGSRSGDVALRAYAFAQYDRLRSLPWPGKGRRSLYRPDGIVPGSERGERYLYWPMGVREPGAMRQWGRHATAFVGRRHFDDPYLLERYFDLR